MARRKAGEVMAIPFGKSCWWRFRSQAPCEWRYGYPTRMGNGLVFMGAWFGTKNCGVVVNADEIEVK